MAAAGASDAPYLAGGAVTESRVAVVGTTTTTLKTITVGGLTYAPGAYLR